MPAGLSLASLHISLTAMHLLVLSFFLSSFIIMMLKKVKGKSFQTQSVMSWTCQGGWSMEGSGWWGEKEDSDVLLTHPEDLDGCNQGP